MKMNTWLAAILIAAMFLGICLPLATSVAWAQSIETPEAEYEPASAAGEVSIAGRSADVVAADASGESCWYTAGSDQTPSGAGFVWNSTYNAFYNNGLAGSPVDPPLGWLQKTESWSPGSEWVSARVLVEASVASAGDGADRLFRLQLPAGQATVGEVRPPNTWTLVRYEAGNPAWGQTVRLLAQGGSSDTAWVSALAVIRCYTQVAPTPTQTPIPPTPTPTPFPTYTPTPRPTNTPWPTYTPTPSTPWRGQTPKWGIYLDPVTGKPKLGGYNWVVANYGRKVYLAAITSGNMAAAADLNAPATTATPTPGNWISGQKTIYRFDGVSETWIEVPSNNQDEFVIAGSLAVAGFGLLGDDVTVVGVVDDPIAIVMLATATGYAVYGIYRDFTEPDIWVSGPDDVLDLTHSLSTGQGLEVNPRSVYVVGDEGVIETRFDWNSRPSDAVWATTYLYASEVGLAHEPAGVLGTMSFWRDGQEREFYLSVGLPDVPALPDALPLPQVIEKLTGKRYKDVELPAGWPTVGPHEGTDILGRSEEELATRRQQRAPSWATAAQKSAANVSQGKPPCDWLGYVPERDTCMCACYTCVLEAALDGVKNITGIIQIFSGQAGMQNTAIPLGSGGIPKNWTPGDISKPPTGGQYKPEVVARDAETRLPITDENGNPVTRPGPRTVDQRNTSDPYYQRCNTLMGGKWGPPAAPAAAALGWSEVQP